jgi:hypothetical protein
VLPKGTGLEREVDDLKKAQVSPLSVNAFISASHDEQQSFLDIIGLDPAPHRYTLGDGRRA